MRMALWLGFAVLAGLIIGAGSPHWYFGALAFVGLVLVAVFLPARPPWSREGGQVSLGRTGGVYALLHAGHMVGDYWFQTDRQARTKGGPGWPGPPSVRRTCRVPHRSPGRRSDRRGTRGRERLSVRRVAAGLVVNAASHYAADRRKPLRLIAERLTWMGKADFYRFGAPRPGRDDNPCLGSGAAALDQAWHSWWLAITAAIIAGG
jgi:hypothetical protein